MRSFTVIPYVLYSQEWTNIYTSFSQFAFFKIDFSLCLYSQLIDLPLTQLAVSCFRAYRRFLTYKNSCRKKRRQFDWGTPSPLFGKKAKLLPSSAQFQLCWVEIALTSTSPPPPPPPHPPPPRESTVEDISRFWNHP